MFVIMLESSNNFIKILLFDDAFTHTSQAQQLTNVLKKAGMQVFVNEQLSTSEDSWKEKFYLNIELTDCAVLILGNIYKQNTNFDKEISYSEYQFKEIQNYLKKTSKKYKIFIWQPIVEKKTIDRKQENFVTSIKNSALHDVTISFQESPILLAEDILLIMNSEYSQHVKSKLTEIFFIYNELDEDIAKDILELLDDVVKIEKLCISQNSNQNHTNFIEDQFKHAKMSVVFFKYTADWAIPFVQQFWKLTGGLSSNSQILLVGEKSIIYNQNKTFAVPNVKTLIISEDMIPLEIKIEFDKLSVK